MHYEIPTPSDNDQLLQAIVDSLRDDPWCERNPYSLTGAERYKISWGTFCKTVKHEIRYFFDSEDEEDQFSDAIPVPRMLAELKDVIDQAGLNHELPVGTQFFRIRPHDRAEVCIDWRSLGSPPSATAVSNRMSAAGISVFYGALDMVTAKAETMANLDGRKTRVYTGAMWANSRPLKVLDLVRLPEIPSFYAQVRYDRDHLLFLHQFVESITQPVRHDGREHTEYVPSQIVTEYFRHRYRLPDKSQLDAIIYPSAQRARGRPVVIFAPQEDLDPTPYEWVREERIPILRLDTASILRIRRR